MADLSCVKPKGLRAKVPHHGIAEVVQPVVVVGVAGQGVLSPVVVRVDLVPKERNHMKSSMHPVHAEGHEVVVGHQSKHPLMKGCHDAGRCWVVAGDCKVETQVEGKLTEQG